jgi:hypothetical protein
MLLLEFPEAPTMYPTEKLTNNHDNRLFSRGLRTGPDRTEHDRSGPVQPPVRFKTDKQVRKYKIGNSNTSRLPPYSLFLEQQQDPKKISNCSGSRILCSSTHQQCTSTTSALHTVALISTYVVCDLSYWISVGVRSTR